ncbi:MAG: gliding motility-associated C-terminal domain-containing protein [Bacteroidetes bacterium]|nr:gliding motility-associated C-terminal domain-containing protein [Bacteroidota bacterium]
MIHKLLYYLKATAAKVCLLCGMLFISSASFAQNTYYWVHNDLNATILENSADQVNATNTGAGTAFWRHFSKVSGSTSTANLLPASTPITSADNIIIDNNSFPAFAATYNMTINHPGALICKNFDAHTFVGGPQKFKITISTNLQVYGNLKLTPSNNFTSISGPSIEFVNGLNTNVDSVYLYGTRQSLGIHQLNVGTIGIKTNGKVIFCDTVYGPNVQLFIIANDNVGDSCQVHFLENIYKLNIVGVRIGFMYVHKNVTVINSFTLGQDPAGGNTAGPATCNAQFISHAPGYFSAPGVWNTGLWADPTSPNGQNKYASFTYSDYRGLADFQNSWFDDLSLFHQSTNGRGTGLKGNAGINQLTNSNTYMRFTGRQWDYLTRGASFKLRGKYVFDQDLPNNRLFAGPSFLNDTIVDTLWVKTNITNWYNTSPCVMNIAPTGYAKFWPGFSYKVNSGTNNYISYPLAFAISNQGKLICGDTTGCSGSAPTKMLQINLLMQPGGTQQFYGTQFYNSQIKCVPVDVPAQRVIHYTNSDMGGNNGLIFHLQAGMQTLNGIVGAGGNYAYGTAPYTAIPFTASKARTLQWDNTISGANYWSQSLWYNTADADNLYNDCPPTFIDSVIVNPGTTLKLDGRQNQCKSFVVLAGATTTLGSKATTAADSINTLEVFGSFLLNQKINNNLQRNIMFKAWQTYPQIKTSGSNFWCGLGFWSLNTSTNPSAETNPGSWTFLDSLNLYNRNIVFTPRPNSAPDCKRINFNAWTYAVTDVPNNFTFTAPTPKAYQFVLTAGRIYTNDKTLHLPSFRAISDATKQQRLYLGKSIINIYEGVESFNQSSPAAAGNMGWLAQDNGGALIIYPGTSHIKFHCKTFMQANTYSSANNLITNVFGTKGLNYYDVSFLQNDTTAATGGGAAGLTRAGIYFSLNCNYHNVTFWNTDGQNAAYPQFRTIRDTINKVYFRYNTGTLNSGTLMGYTENITTPLAGVTNVVNSSIDSLVFDTKLNTLINGIFNIRKYLFFSPGSTNTFQPGVRNVIYSSTSTVLGRAPWVDSTRGHIIGYFNPAEVAPAALPSYTWSPWGAKVKTRTVCDNTTILRYGGFKNAGNAVAYPTPYYWSGTSPRDTFDLAYLTVIDDSLTQFQTVDATTILSGSTLNWDAGSSTPRTLVFRGTAAASGGSWFDKTKWAQITYPGGIKTESPVGQCPPICGDSVIFDNLSFAAPTHSCNLGSANSAYCGTMLWKPGVTGVLAGQSTSVLNICNSLYFNTTMSNGFQGQVVFTASDTTKATEYIQTGKIVFNNQIYFNARNGRKGKWSLLDSIYARPIAAAITPALKVNAGTLDTRGKNLNVMGGFDINSNLQRGALLHNSRLILSGGNALTSGSGNGVAFNVEGDYTKLTLKADSSDIYCTSYPGGVSFYPAHFYTWNGLPSSQRYSSAPKGFKFNRITFLYLNNQASNIYMRSDTINELTITTSGPAGVPQWYHFYKGYVKKATIKGLTSAILIGNGLSVATPLSRFNRNRIDTLRFICPSASPSSMYWDTLYVKDEFTINPGSSLSFAKGGLTWFKNTCAVNIIGTSASPITLNSPAINIGTTYNYPAPTGNRAQNEHYFRKDSGTVCTDYTQLYNIWAIGNGNGNNSCTGGAAFGCSLDAVATATAYGTWMSPLMTPLTNIRTLSDTTFYSSETPSTPTSGRARFIAGANADIGWPNPIGTHNTAGWDPTPSPVFPPASLALSQYTMCPGTVVTVSMTLKGALKTSDFPITITYSVNGVQSSHTYTSGTVTQNPFTFTLSPTANTTITWHDLSNIRCFSNTKVIDSTKVLTVYPTPTINVVASNSVVCSGGTTTLTASGANTYTWTSPSATTPTVVVSPTVATTYTVAGTSSFGCPGNATTFSVNTNSLPVLTVSSQTNVLCFGGNSGAVAFSTTGGAGSGYTVSPSSVSGLTQGSYTYTLTDGNGCKSTTTLNITQPSSALTAVTSSTNNTNCLSPNGSSLATPSGGTSAYSYLWSNGQTSQTATNLTAGTYTVTITDANNCTYTTQATITNPAGPTISASVSSNTICNGGNLTITPSGGTTYSVVSATGTTTTSTNAVYSPTASATYTVYGTNASGCLSNTLTIPVTVNPTPTVSIAAGNPTICAGQTATLTASGTTTYNWINPVSSSASVTVSPSSTSVYSLTGSSAGCSSAITQVTVVVNANPILTVSSQTNVSCFAGTNGAVTFTMSGGAGSGYSVTPATFNNLGQGSYSYTLTDANGCKTNTTVAITQPTAALSGITGIIGNSSCSSPNGQVSITASGGTPAYTYSWSTGATTSFINNLSTGSYSVTVTDANGCTFTSTASVSNPSSPTITAMASSAAICSGTSVSITPSGTNTYSVTGSTGTIITSSSVSFTPTASETYTVVGTNASGCLSNTVTIPVTVNPTPTVNISASSATICSGQTTTLTAATANSYSWISGPPTSTYTVNPSATTVYTVVGTNTTGSCSATAMYTVTVNPTPTVNISASSATICSGQTTTLTAGTANSYAWTSGPTTASYTVNPSATTVYTVVGTNTTGSCSATAMYTVTVNPTPTVNISASSATICSGQTTTLTAATANTYAWSGGPPTATYAVTPASTTVYTVTGTNTIGTCTASAMYTVNVNPTPTVNISASSATICSGQTTTLTAATANTYAWSGGPPTATYAVTPASTTVYTVTGTNTIGTCTASAMYTVNVNPTPTVSIAASNGTICSGQTTTLTAGTANSYSWTSGPTTASYTVNPSATMVYTVVGTNTTGSCSATAMYTVNVNPTPTVNISASSATICSGQTTTLTAGTANSYSWTSGPTTASYTVNPSATMVYTVVGTNTTGSCSATAMYTVNVNPTPTVSIAASNGTICSGQTTTLTAGTANSYSWTSGPTTASYTVNPSATMVYTVTGTNTTGSCSATAMYTVTVNPLPTLAVSSVTNVSCYNQNNGVASFTTNATTSTITGTGISGNTATGLAPGAYTYTITDGNGCKNTTTVSITQPTAAVTASAVVTATNSSCTNPNGILSITAAGGTPSYSYAVDGGAATNSSVTFSLSTGTHSYVVNDANGCVSGTGTVSIAGTPGITSSVSNQLNVLCFGNNTASVTVNGSGGSAYNYTLTPITATTSVQSNTSGLFTGLSAGTYSVFVNEQTSNCISTNTITITQPAASLTLSSLNTTSVLCNGGNGTVVANVSGGTPPYSYTWSSNVSTTNSASYVAGTYSVNIHDANNCVIATQSFVINQPVQALANTIQTNSVLCYGGVATVSATVTGGTPGYTMNWNGIPSASNTQTFTAGTYTMNVTDGNSCSTTTQTFVINQPSNPLSLTSLNTSSVLCNGGIGTAVANVTGGTAPYSYTWSSNGSAVNTASYTAGTYSVDIHDANNCTVATQTFVIAQPAVPLSVSSISNPSVTCAGGIATVSLTATGGTAGYIYTWQGHAPSAVNTQTYAAGTYTALVTDANGCNSAVQNFSVSSPSSALQIVSVSTTTTGCGQSTGTVGINVTGGWNTPAYTYTIMNSINAVVSNTNTATSLPAGAYTATVTDALGCSTQTVFTIGNPVTPTLNIASPFTAICAGQSTTLSPVGANSYTVSNGPVFTSTLNVSPSSTTVYTITGTDASNCVSAPLSVTVTVNALPVLNIAATGTAVCTSGTATLSASGADTYTWSTSQNTNSVTVSPSAATIYTVIGTNTLTGCSSAPAGYTLAVNPLPAVAVVSQTNVACFGGANGSVLLSSSATNTSIAEPTTGLSAGNYTFTVTDLATGCANTVTTSIASPTAALQINSVATTTTGCGLSNGTALANVSGGWNSSAYTYTFTHVLSASTGTVVGNTNPSTNLPAGEYNVSVADAMGCIASTTFTIANPNPASLNIPTVTPSLCAGQSVTLAPTGAVTYTLSSTGTVFTSTVVVSPTVTTVYSITGTDGSSCISAPLSVTVTVNNLPVLSAIAGSTTICAGQTTTLSASGANTYTWSGGPATSTYTVSPSANTIYTVTGTNTLTSCSATTTIGINVNTIPSFAITSQTNVLCYGNNSGAVSFSTSATAYSLNPSGTTGLGGGSYSYTLTDNATGCKNTASVTITAPSQSLSATVTNTTANSSCTTPNGAFTVTATGGTPNYTYNTSNTTGVFTAQSTGTHTVNISDNNGCTYTITAIIPGVPTPSLSAATQTNVLCNGQSNGAAVITATNGTLPYSYSWTNNTSTTNSITSVSANQYVVTLTDAGGCIVTHTFVITQPTAINAVTQNMTEPCVGQDNGALSIGITGGTPDYHVNWSNSASTTGSVSSITNLKAGQYIATITDQNGCSYQYPVQLDAQNGVGCTLVIPEIFSPNGDGKNDTWEIKGLDNYPDNKVTVFNRWGDQVYSNAPYKSDWDGQNTGDKSLLGKGILPVGTYYFILELGNGDKPITGYVQITR